MAEAFLKELAGDRVQVASAGTEPAASIDPMVVEVMREVGIDIGHKKPKGLTPGMIEQADRVITMGCGVEDVCPATSVETEDWGLDDPKGKDIDEVRQIREQIRAMVWELLEKIS